MGKHSDVSVWRPEMVSQSIIYQSCCCSYVSLGSSNSVHADKIVLTASKAIHSLQAKLADVFNISMLIQMPDVWCNLL